MELLKRWMMSMLMAAAFGAFVTPMVACESVEEGAEDAWEETSEAADDAGDEIEDAVD